MEAGIRAPSQVPQPRLLPQNRPRGSRGAAGSATVDDKPATATRATSAPAVPRQRRHPHAAGAPRPSRAAAEPPKKNQILRDGAPRTGAVAKKFGSE